jgi:hypothetical protein
MTPDIPTAFRRVSESCFNQYRQDFCRLLPYAYGTHFAKTAPQGGLHWRTILNDSLTVTCENFRNTLLQTESWYDSEKVVGM